MSKIESVPVELRNIYKSFDNKSIIEDLNLEINGGELLVLLGPSGSGKTTTLRMISGLEKQDSGNIFIGGKSVDTLAPKDRDIAMVFQDYALYPHMNVFDNIAFPLRIRTKFSRSVIESKVKSTVEMLGIQGLLNRKINNVSGGEQQRVALARAIIRDAHLYLLDEPLANLDAKLRVEMRAELQVLHRRLGSTMITVSHDQSDAMTLGTRIAILHEGKLRQIGTPDEVYSKPIDLFVGSFLGTPAMNFLDGTLHQYGQKVEIRLEKFNKKCATINIRSSLKELKSNEVVIGIRPEKINISRHDSDFSINGKVYVVQPVGSDTYAYVKFEKGYSIVLRTSPETPLKVDENVFISWDSNSMHVFDRLSGQRLN